MSIILLSNVSFCYEGSYEPVFENLSANLDTDWHLGLTGRNGRGKTTLLRLMLGSQQHPYGLTGFGGSIGAKVSFVYFPLPVKHPEWLAMEVMEELCPGCPEWKIRRELSLLGVEEDALWRPFETLSGGEKTKLQLAALFLQEGSFPLIDEPTNHLDIESRKIVSEYLRRRKGFCWCRTTEPFWTDVSIISFPSDAMRLRSEKEISAAGTTIIRPVFSLSGSRTKSSKRKSADCMKQQSVPPNGRIGWRQPR